MTAGDLHRPLSAVYGSGMTNTTDKIMALAAAAGDAQAAHAVAVKAFADDRADYDGIPALAEQWVKARAALRAAVNQALREAGETR